jgi:rod shape-determining protein MreC
LGAGLGEGQVIVNDLGLVGRVLHVGDRFSQAAALTHPSSRIPVVFIESRERAVVAGTGQSLLNVLYLSENHRIREGEWAYTSGDDRLLPAGILVGQVVMEAGQPLRLRPSVQWSKLDYVKVFLAP